MGKPFVKSINVFLTSDRLIANNYFNKQLALDVIDKEGIGNYATIADMKSEKKIIEVIRQYTPRQYVRFVATSFSFEK